MPKLTQDDVRKAAEQGAHAARQALLAAPEMAPSSPA